MSHATRDGVPAVVVLACALALGLPLYACAGTKAGGGGAMTTAPMKANGSGVAVEYRVDGTPAAASVVSVLLNFAGITDPAGATVWLTVDGGLSLAPGDTTRTLPAGQVGTWTVDVVPGAAGIGYLHVFTTQYGATSATSVPVQVGKAPAAMSSGSDLKATPGGDKIRAMPVK